MLDRSGSKNVEKWLSNHPKWLAGGRVMVVFCSRNAIWVLCWVILLGSGSPKIVEGPEQTARFFHAWAESGVEIGGSFAKNFSFEGSKLAIV